MAQVTKSTDSGFRHSGNPISALISYMTLVKLMSLSEHPLICKVGTVLEIMR